MRKETLRPSIKKIKLIYKNIAITIIWNYYIHKIIIFLKENNIIRCKDLNRINNFNKNQINLTIILKKINLQT
jgi:hypothetical protein